MATAMATSHRALVFQIKNMQNVDPSRRSCGCSAPTKSARAGMRGASLQDAAVLQNLILQLKAAAMSTAMAAERADMEMKDEACVMQIKDMLNASRGSRVARVYWNTFTDQDRGKRGPSPYDVAVLECFLRQLYRA